MYTAEHPALALLETLVHLEIESLAGLPSHYRLLCIEAPDDLLRETVSDALLGKGWRTDFARTRAIGDAWLRGGAAALLSVPSAVAPNSRNWLVNPSHRDAEKLAIAWAAMVPFDERLVPRRGRR